MSQIYKDAEPLIGRSGTMYIVVALDRYLGAFAETENGDLIPVNMKDVVRDCGRLISGTNSYQSIRKLIRRVRKIKRKQLGEGHGP